MASYYSHIVPSDIEVNPIIARAQDDFRCQILSCSSNK